MDNTTTFHIFLCIKVSLTQPTIFALPHTKSKKYFYVQFFPEFFISILWLFKKIIYIKSENTHFSEFLRLF